MSSVTPSDSLAVSAALEMAKLISDDPLKEEISAVNAGAVDCSDMKPPD